MLIHYLYTIIIYLKLIKYLFKIIFNHVKNVVPKTKLTNFHWHFHFFLLFEFIYFLTNLLANIT